MKKNDEFFSNKLNWKTVLDGVLLGVIIILAIVYILLYIILNYKMA
jgi:hypothetical protein